MRLVTLHLRLAAVLRERVRRGELTERGLARRVGISQPHIHHVLKGARTLSARSADRILDELGLSVLDLFGREELEAGCPQPMWLAQFRALPVLEGLLGPGHPFPESQSQSERFPFPLSELAAVERPVICNLARDDNMPGLLEGANRALLDRSEAKRRHTVPDGVYGIEWQEQGLVRYVRKTGSHLIVSSVAASHDISSGHSISLANRNILDVVRAKVIWIGRRLEPLLFAKQPSEETG